MDEDGYDGGDEDGKDDKVGSSSSGAKGSGGDGSVNSGRGCKSYSCSGGDNDDSNKGGNASGKAPPS